MEYILKHFDTPLLRFTANADSADPDYQITWFDEAHRKLLPGDINTVSEEELDRWIRHRTILKNRAFVHDLLAICTTIRSAMSLPALSSRDTATASVLPFCPAPNSPQTECCRNVGGGSAARFICTKAVHPVHPIRGMNRTPNFMPHKSRKSWGFPQYPTIFRGGRTPFAQPVNCSPAKTMPICPLVGSSVPAV